MCCNTIATDTIHLLLCRQQMTTTAAAAAAAMRQALTLSKCLLKVRVHTRGHVGIVVNTAVRAKPKPHM
jgi:hypothetical protein